MKIRDIHSLEAALTEELKWRKNELEQWKNFIRRARKHELPAILRAGIPLLYAHWEGYLKTACSYYMEYVSRKGFSLDQLRDELAALALRSDIVRLAEHKHAASQTEVIRKVRNGRSVTAILPYDDPTIRTGANIDFEEFRSIMLSVGCDSDRHQLQQFTIDNRLLRLRNAIAHGRYEFIDVQDWMDIKERIVPILEDVRAQLSNAASLKTYHA